MTTPRDPQPPHTPDDAPLTPSEQYLWDKTGTPDAATLDIENALRPLRYTAALDAPASRPRRNILGPVLALAAALAVASVTYILLTTHPKKLPPAPASNQTFALASSHGDVTLSEPTKLKADITERTLATAEKSTANLTLGKESTVTVEPNTKVKLAEGNDQWPWLALSDGAIFAQVAQTDRPLTVGVLGDSIAIQPGSAASIQVRDEYETAEITCKTGELHITWKQKPTRVVGPATCTITINHGPSLPLPSTLSPAACATVDNLSEALAYSGKSPDAASQLLASYLRTTSRQEAPLLWNLMWRVQPQDRKAVRDRLAFFIKQPKVHPDSVLKLDPAAMDAWWKAAVEAASDG